MTLTPFQPEGIFYDALSEPFTPPTDPLGRAHTLARLAVGACDKGETFELTGEMIYYPGWANQSYCVVDQPPNSKPFNTQIRIAEAYGRWPSELMFTHYTSNPTFLPRRKGLVISGRNLEEIHELELGPQLNAARLAVRAYAQEFYNRLRPNV